MSSGAGRFPGLLGGRGPQPAADFDQGNRTQEFRGLLARNVGKRAQHPQVRHARRAKRIEIDLLRIGGPAGRWTGLRRSFAAARCMARRHCRVAMACRPCRGPSDEICSRRPTCIGQVQGQRILIPGRVFDVDAALLRPAFLPPSTGISSFRTASRDDTGRVSFAKTT